MPRTTAIRPDGTSTRLASDTPSVVEEGVGGAVSRPSTFPPTITVGLAFASEVTAQI
jgi:hypothetical protein